MAWTVTPGTCRNAEIVTERTTKRTCYACSAQYPEQVSHPYSKSDAAPITGALNPTDSVPGNFNLSGERKARGVVRA
jgi:hypothetical protein